ncbi:UNVERIFIED_ORG: hypothetical protein FHR35_007317 [Microbispora rosea subsp. rosea]
MRSVTGAASGVAWTVEDGPAAVALTAAVAVGVSVGVSAVSGAAVSADMAPRRRAEPTPMAGVLYGLVNAMRTTETAPLLRWERGIQPGMCER